MSDKGKTDRKSKQLCAQVRRVLSQYLSFEVDDEVLQSVFVEAVDPAPDATCVAVTLSVPRELEVSRGDVLERLARVKAALRSEVARAVSRSKVPDLNFVVMRAAD